MPPAAPAIKMAVPATSTPSANKSVRFSDTTYTKPYVIEVKEGAQWRKLKDPRQRRPSPRLCDEKVFLTDEHKESFQAHTEAARSVGYLLYEVANKRRRRHGQGRE